MLEPSVNFMAPEKVCWIMHALNKGTLDETFIVRQIVDAKSLGASLHALQFLLLPPRLEGFRETAAGPCALILPVSD